MLPSLAWAVSGDEQDIECIPSVVDPPLANNLHVVLQLSFMTDTAQTTGNSTWCSAFERVPSSHHYQIILVDTNFMPPPKLGLLECRQHEQQYTR